MCDRALEILLSPLNKNDVPPEILPITEIRMNFEPACWKAVYISFIGEDFTEDGDDDPREKSKFQIIGCAFHWAKKLILKIAELILRYKFVNKFDLNQVSRIKKIQSLHSYHKRNSKFKKYCKRVIVLYLASKEKI